MLEDAENGALALGTPLLGWGCLGEQQASGLFGRGLRPTPDPWGILPEPSVPSRRIALMDSMHMA